MTNKKAAIELSISTVVIIVIAMSMLILGLVLVKQIFTSASESVDILDSKVKDSLSNLLGNEKSDVVIKLGTDQTARVKADSNSFGVAIGARTKDGAAIDNPARLKFQLTLDDSSDKNCLKILGKSSTKALFITKLEDYLQFDEFQGSNAFSRVQIKIPKGTAVCTQKIFVDVKDANDFVGRNSFIIEVLKSSFF